MQNTQKMEIEGLKSPIITIGDNLLEVLKKVLKKNPPSEGSMLVITSKVLAITQGRIVKIQSRRDFVNIVKKEADQIIGGDPVILTMKNNVLIPWAGIDRSNIKKGFCVLWPEKPFEEAATICRELKKHFKLKKLGIIIADSTCAPLRRGVHSFALGYAGFYGVHDLRGEKDLFGNTLKVTQQAVADNLATAASIVMGESDEAIPFALIRGARLQFTNRPVDPAEPVMPKDQCLFQPAYKF